MEEAELIERAKTDKEAFGQLYEIYVKRIYNYIYYRVSNVHDAEDLTAAVFIRAMQHIGRYQEQGVPFSAWLYRIARNMVFNWHRDHSRRQMIDIEDIANWYVSDANPELVSQLMEDKVVLSQAIRELPSERQELLMFKFVERLSNAEIGEIMGRSEGAIKSLYHRTLSSLREYLEENSTLTANRPQPRSFFSKWLS